MIHVKVHTERVYSHGTDGMPKIEAYSQTLESTFEFPKFLKYLPFQNYLNEKLKVERVFETTKDGHKDLPIDAYQKMLEDVIKTFTTPEKTIHDKYEDEKLRNEDLMNRLAALEAKMSEKDELKSTGDEKMIEFVNNQMPIETKVPQQLDEAALRAKYFKQEGKKAHHLWSAETIAKKLKD